jgi:dolichol-phosphate mannosyltransferase
VVSVELGRFMLVGLSGVVVNSLALMALYERLGMPFAAASMTAVELAIVSNYIGNERFTFSTRKLSAIRFAKFNLISLLGLAITTGTAWLALNELGVHYLLANLAGIGVAALCSFGLHRRWTYRQR